jgi:hypothetical protein
MTDIPEEVIEDVQALSASDLAQLREHLGNEIVELRFELNGVVDARGELLSNGGGEINQDPTLAARREQVADKILRCQFLLNQVIETRGEMNYYTQVPD